MKLSQSEFAEFQREYFAKPGPLRIGQAFCNKYDISNHALFYEADVKKALKYIADTYVQSFYESN